MSYRLSEIKLVNEGIVAHHSMPCAVCGIQHAIYDCQRGYYSPCRRCQNAGWELRHRPKRSLIDRLLGRNRGDTP